MPTDTKPAHHSPTPWRAEVEEIAENLQFAELFDADGLHIAAHLSPEDAAHIIACANGTDARTRALVGALEGMMRIGLIATAGYVSDEIVKARAALARAKG